MENEKNKKGLGLFALGLVIGLLVSLVIVSVIYRQHIDVSEDSLLDQRVAEKIESLEKLIHDRFYLSEVTEEEMEEGIYRGIIASLNDPYSEYYTVTELQELMEQSEGIYYGIGAYVSLDEVSQMPKISGVMDGSPALEADLRPGDVVYEVDGESTYGLSLSETVALIKGPEGTQVTLTILREGESDYRDVTINRKKLESPTVEFEMLEDGMAYIQITEFDDVTVEQYAEAYAEAKASNMSGMILDLRANPGGSLNAVVEIAQMMLPEGLIVYTEDKAGKRSEYFCDGQQELDVPLVVLVDGNSASAAEILSGAIQDYKLGTLVGTTTFGKGIVQQIIGLNDGSAIKMTISSYFTPNGRNIHGTGIEPDVECEFDGETYYSTEDHYDNQLEKAKEVLRGMM